MLNQRYWGIPLYKSLKRLARSGSHFFATTLANAAAWEHLMLLQGTHAAFAVRRIDSVQSLADVEFKVFSQFGDDGIIEWLVSRLADIPTVFVEFGVADYKEANTRFLLFHRNWRGLVMDASAKNIEMVRRHQSYWRHELTAVAAFIDCDNIDRLIADSGYSGEIGVLHIDIDGNDYWVWQATTVVDPWIVIVEYNATFGDVRPLTIPYDAAFLRGKAHASNLYYGAGIKALEHLASVRGYTMLGTNRAGNNSYFLRNDLLPYFEGRIADRRAGPAMFREARANDGSLAYTSGRARRQLIADMFVVDVDRGATLRFGDIEGIYSARWLEIMGASKR